MATANAVAASTKETGTVKWFHAERGYGFISRDDAHGGDADVFVHFSQIITEDPDAYKEFIKGDRVEFDVVAGKKGLCANSVKLI
jgi:CspA family cold shock protein